MSPYIVALRPDDYSLMARSHLGESIAEAGQDIAGIIERKRSEEREAKLAGQRLDVERARALQAALRERRILAEHEQAQGERAAEMQDFEERAGAHQQQVMGREVGTAFAQGLVGPGGKLGPFGSMNARALGEAAKAAHAVQQRMAGRMELARQMAPTAAKAWLAREVEGEKVEIKKQGYKNELVKLQDAIAEGVITDEKRIKEYQKAIRTGIRTGEAPGEVEKRLAQEYDIQAKLRVREQDWAHGDKEAADLLASVGETFKKLPAEFQDKMQAKLGEAKTEWQRTRSPTYREKNDAGPSISGIQQILFGMQAAENPKAFAGGLEEERNRLDLEALGESETRRPRNMRAAPPASAAVPQRSAPSGAAAAVKKSPEQLVRGYVRDNADIVLAAGGSSVEKVRKLRESIARDLGVDPYSPEARAALRDELENVLKGRR